MITPEQRKEFDKLLKKDDGENRQWEIGYKLPDGGREYETTCYGTEDDANDALNDLLEAHGIKLYIYPALPSS